MPNFRKGWFTPVTVVAGTLLTCLALRGWWVERSEAPGQFHHGYFEGSLDREVFLTLDERDHSDVFPTTHVDESGRLYLPPGRTVGIPIGEGRRVRVTTDAVEMAPSCAIGAETLAEGDEEPGVWRLANGLVPAARDGKLTLVPWNPRVPWRDDESRLRALRDSCASGRDPEPLVLRRAEDGTMEVAYGRCSAVPPASLIGTGGVATMVVLAGPFPAWVELERGWETRWRIDPKALAGAAVLSLVALAALALVFGRPAAFVIASASAVASLLVLDDARTPGLDLLVVMGLCLALAASVMAALYRIVARWTRAWPAPVRVATFLGATVLLSGLAVLAGRPATPGFSPKDWRAEGERPFCVLAGYSLANNDALRDREGGTWGRLAASCSRCRGGAALYAANGQTFPFIREFLCAPDAPLTPSQTLVFLGGINDDLLTEVNRGAVGRLAVSLLDAVPVRGLARALREPTFGQLRELEGLLSRDVLHRFDEQEAILRDGLRCARERGLRFVFLHDLLVTDLPEGPPPERAAMLERRRSAVETSGGRFVGLKERFHGEIGVAWFNDFCHLSEVGHERVADLACSLVEGNE